MTTRDEVLGRLARGRAYLERSDLSPEERERAQERYDELRAELRKMDEPPPKVEDPRIPEAIARIREILYSGDGKHGTHSPSKRI